MSTPPSKVIIRAAAGSLTPLTVVGGLSVLDRLLLRAQHAGTRHAIVAWDGDIPHRPGRTIVIEQVAPDAPLPDDVETISADDLDGMALTSPRQRRRAEWHLLKSLPKSFQGPVDALINCHISLRITRVLAHTSLTPNHITVFALLLGIAAAVVLMLGTRTTVALGGAMMAFQSIVDSCDGELARLRYQFSRLGQWLDNIADDITDSLLMFALGVATGETLWLWVGAAAGGARVFTQLALYVNVTRIGGDFWNFRWFFETETETLDEVYNFRSPLVWVRSLGRRDAYLFLWAVLCIAGQPVIATAYGAAISAVYLILTLIQLVVDRPAQPDD